MDKIVKGVLVVAVLFIGFAIFTKDTTVVVENDSFGAFASPDIYSEVRFHNGMKNFKLDVTAKANTSQYATTTLSILDSGSTYFLTGSGTLMTLPSVAEGLNFKFVVSDALDTANVVIDSAEGDNIEGTLIVAGAVVDCAGEDQINIVVDGENVGDYVELMSDGTQWLIGDSGVLTAGKMTCTDPS